MNDNQISAVEKNGFTALNGLKSLWLHDNKLNTLESSVFDGIPRPLQLSLSFPYSVDSFPWKCDTLCWLKEEEMAGNITWVHRPQCPAYPVCAGDQTWDDLLCMYSYVA